MLFILRNHCYDRTSIPVTYSKIRGENHFSCHIFICLYFFLDGCHRFVFFHFIVLQIGCNILVTDLLFCLFCLYRLKHLILETRQI
ncbi:hypothetical protein HanIR_Chr17g0872691 [Helianthus annuus]|nr:hypothetical protein HanIR_Chr17g0872691 [Helianthus annuus]